MKMSPIALECEQCGKLLKDKKESRAHDCRRHTFKPVRFGKQAFCQKFGHTFKETAVKVGENCIKKVPICGPESCCGDAIYEDAPANACKVTVICQICGWTESRDEIREKHELKPKKNPR